MAEKLRIAKAIAASGLCSRRDAERLILSGRVSLNGKIVESPALNIGDEDVVEVDGKKIEAKVETKLFIYNKPVGLIVSHNDENRRKTVFETLPKELGRLISIGRLDLNSEGLLLLTNDGEFQRFMERPKNEFERVYEVRVRGVPTQENILKLKAGVVVDGIKYKPIEVKVIKTLTTNCWLEVKLYEGKNREIRQVMESIGLDVNRLIRTSYAGLELRNLKDGGIYETKIPQKIWEKFIQSKSDSQ